MYYRIIDTIGNQLDHGHCPARSHVLASHVETWCSEHNSGLVRIQPNSTFTEITVTVESNNPN